MVSTLFRDPQARSSALAALGTLQPQAFGSLNCIETLDSTSNYYLIYRFTRSPSKSISSSIIHLHWGTSGFRGTDIDRRSDCCCATDSQYCHEEEHVRLYMHWCIHAYDICCTLSLWIHNSRMHNRAIISVAFYDVVYADSCNVNLVDHVPFNRLTQPGCIGIYKV